MATNNTNRDNLQEGRGKQDGNQQNLGGGQKQDQKQQAGGLGAQEGRGTSGSRQDDSRNR